MHQHGARERQHLELRRGDPSQLDQDHPALARLGRLGDQEGFHFMGVKPVGNGAGWYIDEVSLTEG